MKKLIGISAFVVLVGCIENNKNKTKLQEFKIGVIADCQYCHCEAQNNRYYHSSPERLKAAVDTLNAQSLDFTIHLGDFIDQNFASFDTLLPIWHRLNSKRYHVLGNHDFSVADSLKPLIFEKMNIQKRYYSIVKNNWRFIVLDGNDLSEYGALNESKAKQTDSLFNALSNKDLPNLQSWNGGLSNEQLKWVDAELKTATKNKEQVGFFCHFPALGVEQTHNLWNYEQLLAKIDEYPCVKFYFNGHNHDGSYVQREQVHYLTFKGMVDTNHSNAFATVTFTKDTLRVKGYGRETSRNLIIN